MARFDIVLQTRGSLHPEGEPDDYISDNTGVIRCTRDHDGQVSTVGKVRAFRIHAGLARQGGESVFDVCDAHSEEMRDLYAALFDRGEDDLKEAIVRQFDALDPDVLVLDWVLLHPRWRGLKLGLLAARRVADLLGGGCGLAVSWIHPLNPDAEEFEKVPRGWIPRPAGRGEEREARRKLRRYFRRMGFERIKKTKYHGLPTARVTPTLEDLLRPEG